MKLPIALVLLSASTALAAVDETIEPPILYTLSIGGKEQVVQLGKGIQIAGTFDNPEVMLTAKDTRRFASAGITFDYPAQYGWSASASDANPRTWILSGNSFKIMVFAAAAGLDARAVADEMAVQFKAPTTAISPVTRRFGKTDLRGFRLKAAVLNARFNIDVLAIPSKSGGRVLMLQDTLPDEGLASAESGAALELLRATFALTQ
jgi:hypothetical protein